MTQILNRWNGNVIADGEMGLYELVLHTVKTAQQKDACANLCDADLRGANLRGANLCGADLRGANLCGANLCDANLCGANLRGDDLCDIKIKTTAVFTGLYKYIAMPVIAMDETEHIRLGCHFRSVSDWESNFCNNDIEFPNNGDMPSKLRWLAYQTCLQWLELNREVYTTFLHLAN